MSVDYNVLLYEKMKAEYDNFIAELKEKSVEEIIERSYEKVILEDLLTCIENDNLKQEEAKALYQIENPLSFIYQEWINIDNNYMDLLRDTIDETTKKLINSNKEITIDDTNISKDFNVPYEADKQIMTYNEMTSVFREAIRKHHPHVVGYIVFTEDSFDQIYSLESRTYEVSSNNKAFIPNMSGYSIYGSSIDGSDINIRLEAYMRGENAWKVDRCYMKKEDVESVEKYKSQRDLER